MGRKPHVAVYPPTDNHTSYRLRYTDPVTGKRRWASADTTIHREAERAAARLEDELATGGHRPAGDLDWEKFCERWKNEGLSGQADKTVKAYSTVINWVNLLVAPRKVSSLTTAVLSRFAAELRRQETEAGGRRMGETSVKTYLGHLGVMLAWAKSQRIIAAVPELPSSPRAKRDGAAGMKGRPLTDTEFAAMLVAVPGVVGDAAAPSWRHWMEGLWWGGFRLEESLELYWDRPDKMRPDLSGKHPMLRIRDWLEKGHRDRLLPLAPEFADFLKRTPEDLRVGPVFILRGIVDRLGRPPRCSDTRDADWIGRICSRIGKAAGIVVDAADGGKVKYASAHDLRRSFGVRWAQRVMPPVLQQLMRHEDIKTTMKYYVSINAEQLAGTVWDAYRRMGGEVTNGPGSGPGTQDGSA